MSPLRVKHPHVASPVFAGAIPPAGIVEKLTAIEARRTTGVLRWRGASEGEVALVRGQIVADQKARADGLDPVELLLDERDGTFEVFQVLPALPVSRATDGIRRGSLEVHVAADLMRYCEDAGLTGLLAMEHVGRRAEIGYDCGELVDIRLDGLGELHEVFAWDEGSFEIVALSRAPNLGEDFEDAVTTEMVRPNRDEEPTTGDASAKLLLRVVEMTLAEIVEEREQRRPAVKVSPPATPRAAPRKHPTLPPPEPSPSRVREPTVRIFYLGGQASAPKDEGVRHVSRSVELESELPDAAPARRSQPASPLAHELPPARERDVAAGRPISAAVMSASHLRAGEATLQSTHAAPAAVATMATEKERDVTTTPASSSPDDEKPADAPAAKGAASQDAVAQDAAGQASTGVGAGSRPRGSLPTAAWALISLALVIVALLALAAMPPLE